MPNNETTGFLLDYDGLEIQVQNFEPTTVERLFTESARAIINSADFEEWKTASSSSDPRSIFFANIFIEVAKVYAVEMDQLNNETRLTEMTNDEVLSELMAELRGQGCFVDKVQVDPPDEEDLDLHEFDVEGA
jgi:hypothetical protein